MKLIIMYKGIVIETTEDPAIILRKLDEYGWGEIYESDLHGDNIICVELFEQPLSEEYINVF